MSADASASPDAVLAAMTDAALEAGAAIMRVFEGDRSHAIKGDGSPVTEADRAAEALIERRLATAFPGLPVVAEEAASEGRMPRLDGGRFFLVDPLDGTREFVAGLYDFTVNIALIENGAAVAGVVFAPAYGELFVGSSAGAFKSHMGKDGARGAPAPIRARPEPERPIALVSHSRHDAGAEAFLARFDLDAKVPIGSSLKYCRIAEGAADIHAKLGRTMEWDTAAAQAVLEAAGGSLLTLDGAPLRYGKHGPDGEADAANPYFVARGLPAEASAAESVERSEGVLASQGA